MFKGAELKYQNIATVTNPKSEKLELIEHIPHALALHLDLHTAATLLCVCFIDDLYLFDILGEQKALVGVQLIGVANKM